MSHIRRTVHYGVVGEYLFCYFVKMNKRHKKTHTLSTYKENAGVRTIFNTLE